jgi:hypothetical protein
LPSFVGLIGVGDADTVVTRITGTVAISVFLRGIRRDRAVVCVVLDTAFRHDTVGPGRTVYSRRPAVPAPEVRDDSAQRLRRLDQGAGRVDADAQVPARLVVPAVTTPIVIAERWFEELKRLAPTE